MRFSTLTFVLFSGICLTLVTPRAYAATGYIVPGFATAKLCDTVPACTDFRLVNFRPASTLVSAPVTVTDTAVTGQFWGSSIGWGDFTTTSSAVTNTTSGVLGGYAWSHVGAWINFAPTYGGVSISPTTGEFSGWAWVSGKNGGWLKFDCSDPDACVKTDWQPTGGSGTTGGGTTGSGTGTGGTTGGGTTGGSTTGGGTTGGSGTTGGGTTGSGTGTGGTTGGGTIDGGTTASTDFSFPPNGAPLVPNIPVTAIALIGAFMGLLNMLASPIKLSSLPFMIFGIRRKPWGVVFDSVTKQPIDPAYVVLRNDKGDEVATAVTDIDGRYGFSVAPGVYTLVANKTNYLFPSKTLSGQTHDEVYSDLYFGETILVEEREQLIAKNIPLDMISEDWNEKAKRDMKVLHFYRGNEKLFWSILAVLFYIGFAFAIYAFIREVSVFNTVILALYILMEILRRIGVRPIPFGTVTTTLGVPMSGAVVRVFSAATNTEVIHKVTNDLGRYYCLLQNGAYYVGIDIKNNTGAFQRVLTTSSFRIKHGRVDEEFVIDPTIIK